MTNEQDFHFDETLRNGLAVAIRTLRPSDREKIAAAVRSLDRQSIYMRLFGYRGELTEAGLDRIMRMEPGRELVLVVTARSGDDEVVIGSGRGVVSDAEPGKPPTAEVAFMVGEGYQGLGIASRILKHLAEIARSRGIGALEADVLSENKAMLAVFARSGLPMRQRREGGVVHVTLSLQPA